MNSRAPLVVRAVLGSRIDRALGDHPDLEPDLSERDQGLVDAGLKDVEWDATVVEWVKGAGPGSVKLHSGMGAPGLAASGQTLPSYLMTEGSEYKFWVAEDELLGGAPHYIIWEAAELTTRVSLSTTGAEPLDASGAADVARGGDIVVFASSSNNLSTQDGNGATDVYVRNQPKGLTTLVSMNPAGVAANGASYSPSVSDDGRFVAFTSDASDLVSDDDNDATDVFVRDLKEGVTARVSKAADGSQLNGPSRSPDISPDGRFVSYESEASNATAADQNGLSDIYVHDVRDATTELVSIAMGAQDSGDGASISPSIGRLGRYVSFSSSASDLIASDLNGVQDVFVRDRQVGSTMRASVGGGGVEANGRSGAAVVSADAPVIAFESEATNLVRLDSNGPTKDAFVHDLSAGATTLVSRSTMGTQGVNASGRPSISADGDFVAFWSNNALQAVDTNTGADVYVHAVRLGQTTIVSLATSGTVSNSGLAIALSGGLNVCCGVPVIDDGAYYVVFESPATNLVVDDGNGVRDVFGHKILFD